MTRQEDIEQQQERLRTERATLADLLIQQARLGSAYAPPSVLGSIREARADICRIKATLRSWDVDLADHPDDEVIPDSLTASTGLDALRDLMPWPVVRKKVAAFQADFQIASQQIAIMGAYKELHDRFQELESCYYAIHYFIYQHGQLVLVEQLSWESLERSEPDLQGFIQALLRYAAQEEVAADLVSWPQTLGRAGNELQVAVEQHDSMLLKRATSTIRGMIDNQPSRINDRLFGAASTLRRIALMQKLLTLRDELAELSLDPAAKQRFVIFDEGVTAFPRLSERLVRAIDYHNNLQEIDNQLRRVEATLEQDLSELYYAWEDLRPITRQLCNNNPDTWAVGLGLLAAQLEDALERHASNEVMRTFRKYRSQAGHSFHQVDRDLLGVCKELKEVGVPLAALLKEFE